MAPFEVALLDLIRYADILTWRLTSTLSSRDTGANGQCRHFASQDHRWRLFYSNESDKSYRSLNAISRGETYRA